MASGINILFILLISHTVAQIVVILSSTATAYRNLSRQYYGQIESNLTRAASANGGNYILVMC